MSGLRTQSERRSAPSRRLVTTGSTLLAVMILLSMLPPGASVMAADIGTGATIEFVHRTAVEGQRREHRVARSAVKVIKLSATKYSGPAPYAVLAFAGHVAAPSSSDRRTSWELPDSSPTFAAHWVREALLSLPPPMLTC